MSDSVPAEAPTLPDPPDQRFRTLVEGLDAIVWEMDVATWRFTYVSPQAEPLLGYPTESWFEDSFWTDRLVHPEDRGWAVPFCTSATEEARDHEFDYRALAADGRVVWLRDVVRVVCDTGGKARLLRGVMVDVTEAKEAERKLQEQLRHAALSSEVGAAIADGGPLREILQRCAAAMVEHLDAAFARVWTLNGSEPVLELQASAGLYTHLDGPHGRVPVGAFKIGLIAQERAPHLTNDVTTDPRVSDKEWAEREGMVSFAGYPLLADGRLVGVMAMFARCPLGEETLTALRTVADRVAMIVQRKQTDAALREREIQLAEAQRIAQLGSWEWEVGTDAVEWSDELYRIYGLEPQSEPITLESYLARVHPDDRERVGETVGEASRTGAGFDFEERIVRPDGSVRLLLSRGRGVPDGAGGVAKLIGTCQDVTEQRAAAARDLELSREQAARLRAEAEEERTAFLAEAGRVLSSSLDYDTTLRTFAHLAVPRIADWCAIDIVEEDGSARRVVTAHPDPAKEEMARELERRYPSPSDAPTGVPHVLRTGESEMLSRIPAELLEAAAVDEEHLRIIRDLRLHSYMVLPLIARGRTLGAITFVSAESERSYEEDDLHFAQELAGRAALAVDNARLYHIAEEAREHNTRILASITDAFFALDEEWRFTYVNPEAERVLHRGAAELLHENIWDAFPEAVGSTFERAYREAVGTGQTVQFEEFFPPLDTWFEVRAFPSSDGLSVFFRNVNERHRAEDELRRSEERFRFMTNAVPVQIWTARPDGSLTFVSDRTAAYFGVTPEELVGQGWLSVVHPDDHDNVVERWTNSLRTGDPYEVQFRLRAVTGEYRWHLGRADAHRDPDGEILRWLGSNTDIEDQKEAEAERERLIGALDTERRRLEITNRELDQFAYVASHDLKAPLRGIANLSQWIEEDLEGQMSGEVREHLDLLRGRVHRMEGLIDGVLEYSRAGRVRESPARVEVGPLLEEVIDLVAPPDGFQVRVAGTMPTLVTERLPLQQVFMNLISNAAKYSRDVGGSAEVRAEREGSFHRFTVSDDGPGIAPEYHERIFGIFQTLAARDKVEGTGIGLSLVMKIVEARGGRVWVESEEGAGASFHFLWPTEARAT